MKKILFLLLLASTPSFSAAGEPASEDQRRLWLVFSSNVNGEVDPCG